MVLSGGQETLEKVIKICYDMFKIPNKLLVTFFFLEFKTIFLAIISGTCGREKARFFHRLLFQTVLER